MIKRGHVKGPENRIHHNTEIEKERGGLLIKKGKSKEGRERGTHVLRGVRSGLESGRG